MAMELTASGKRWNRGKFTGARKGKAGYREFTAMTYGLRGLLKIRLAPGQRPIAVYETDDDLVIACNGDDRAPIRASYYDRAPVSMPIFLRIRERLIRGKLPKDREAYLWHPNLLEDVKAWAQARLSHVPTPGQGGAGTLVSHLRGDCEAWMMARRWPIRVSCRLLSRWLAWLGYGRDGDRWNCALRTLKSTEGDDDDV